MLFSNCFFLETVPEEIEFEVIKDNFKNLFLLYEKSLHEGFQKQNLKKIGSMPVYVHPNQIYIFKSSRRNKKAKLDSTFTSLYLVAFKNFLTFKFKKNKIRNFICYE
jgi:hypothetical protein